MNEQNEIQVDQNNMYFYQGTEELFLKNKLDDNNKKLSFLKQKKATKKIELNEEIELIKKNYGSLFVKGFILNSVEDFNFWAFFKWLSITLSLNQCLAFSNISFF